jgi:hypothetical protein
MYTINANIITIPAIRKPKANIPTKLLKRVPKVKITVGMNVAKPIIRVIT